MDLSNFIGKAVQLTFRNGEKCTVVIKKTCGGIEAYPFNFVYNDEFMNFTKEGKFLHRYEDSQYDIIKIEHYYTKPMTEPLKDETMRTMVRCLTPEAIHYIQGHEKYAEVIFSLFNEFLSEKIGEVNEQVKLEMSCFFMDGIDIRAV